MLKVAKTAANIANDPVTFNQGRAHRKRRFPITIRFPRNGKTPPWRRKFPLFRKLNDRLFELDEKVTKARVFQRDETSYVMFYSSEGLLTCDYRPMATLGVVCVMEKDGQMENDYSARSIRQGFEFLNDDLVEELAQEAIKKTNFLFGAGKPKAGELPVVLGAGGSGILLHEAMGHPFEADFNRKGESIFSDKMGKSIAKDFINIVEDGTMDNNRGAINVDDEGNDVKKVYLVKDGVLESYLHDRISAKLLRSGSHRKWTPTILQTCSASQDADHLYGKWSPHHRRYHFQCGLWGLCGQFQQRTGENRGR